jgi:hypothetical protein
LCALHQGAVVTARGFDVTERPIIMSVPIWKPVAGFERRYEVSNTGLVRSLSTYRPQSGGVLKPWVQNKGYCYVSLRGATGERKSFAVHSLVLEAFVCSRPAGKQCAHGDGNPGNNAVENLRWASAKENIADRATHGRTAIGEANAATKLDRFSVRTIKQLKGTGVSAYAVARLACVAVKTIERIWKGETWKHV